MDYIKEYDNIIDFYRESVTFDEKEGNRYQFDEFFTDDDPNFRGLSFEEAEKSKYTYKKGLDELKELDLDTTLGGSKAQYRWNEFDGDDLDYDRMLSGSPCMHQRIKKAGIGTGKIIELHINIAEPWFIGADKMLLKAFTAVRIADFLETNGYRVAIYVFVNIHNIGYYKKTCCDLYRVNVCIKRAEEPLLKGMLLTCISPWFFRIHYFRHIAAKINCNSGLGSPRKLGLNDTKERITLDTEECLTEASVKEKLKKIEKLFEIENE